MNEQWALNSSATNCKNCASAFSFFNRKHHCRICGEIFCSKCTANKRAIPEEYGYGSTPQKICDSCLNVLQGKSKVIAAKKEVSAPPTKPTQKVDKGVEDMIMLSSISEETILDNLKKRFENDLIYTYIGHVLISVNPFKHIKDIYSERTLQDYRAKYIYEMPPNIYMIAEMTFREMVRECQNQCVIISGESGAGKTEASKKIMEYISVVSGKDINPSASTTSASIKDVILDSNPLLEAFGNAKTIRNNNSSRFGKYMEIKFSASGVPKGGRINNYLLEKSRVVFQTPEERNFHIFYQILEGVTPELQREFKLPGCPKPSDFHYLKQGGCYKVDNIDDFKEYNDTFDAMGTMNISGPEQKEIMKVCLAILYLGNLKFQQGANDKTKVTNKDILEVVSSLIGCPSTLVEQSLVTRLLQSGGNTSSRASSYSVPLNVPETEYSRDAFAKSLYSRLFDWIVAKINQNLYISEDGKTASPGSYIERSAAEADKENAKSKFKTIGVLDIYGFEIFGKNGFEQLCINYVNERLQQIFIELTLKTEQEEYHNEKIKWEQVDFFNNKICCDLIDSKRPAGIFAILDDSCQLPKGTDQTFYDTLVRQLGTHKHFSTPSAKFQNNIFTLKHYAGDVVYSVDNFLDKNKDTLFQNLIQLCQSSNSDLIVNMFPEKIDKGSKKAPTTAGFKIKESISALVTTLSKCSPHYVRCIKPNEKKAAGLIDKEMLVHQIKYLGLYENVRVRRAGFAYRQIYSRFFFRYRVVCDKTWPNWSSRDYKQGCQEIISSLGLSSEAAEKEVAWGLNKIFIKHPELVFTLEEMREQKVWNYAIKIQHFFKVHVGRHKFYHNLQMKGAEILQKGGKERRRNSINSIYKSDYTYFSKNDTLQDIIERYGEDKAIFTESVWIYTARGERVKRTLALTHAAIYFFGITQRVYKNKSPRAPTALTSNDFFFSITRRILVSQITSIVSTKRADNFFVINVNGQHSQVVQGRRKTEFFASLNVLVNDKIPFQFEDSISVVFKSEKKKSKAVPKTLNSALVSGTEDGGSLDQKTLTINADSGLPASTAPSYGSASSGGRKERQF
eukprot:TRINITY_DN10948_c0_g1_i1.p1 TRINITY_DN10948_c0_g1~~TRINITY_DN10948_c0_g1_i1.p1  ORF type:complete len:1073 (-),score=420.88 TRINITY_DN10948_c0_g1_i1:105-3323(-)